MHKNIIAVDIDSTLHEYMHTVALVALNEYGVRLEGPAQDWESVFPASFDQSKHVEVYKRCHDKEYMFLTKPYPGAVEALSAFNDLGYNIYYVSDRKQEAYNDTVDWLTTYEFPTPSNLVCSQDKRVYLSKNADKLATIIDDRPRTLIMARYTLGISDVFSLKHDYNRNLTDIPGVHLFDDWQGIQQEFNSIFGGAN